MSLLENGQDFPSLTAPDADSGAERTFPDEFEGEWSILLFYRGRW